MIENNNKNLWVKLNLELRDKDDERKLMDETIKLERIKNLYISEIFQYEKPLLSDKID